MGKDKVQGILEWQVQRSSVVKQNPSTETGTVGPGQMQVKLPYPVSTQEWYRNPTNYIFIYTLLFNLMFIDIWL